MIAPSPLSLSAGPGAARFAQGVETLMRSELDWVAWKREGCPVFERAVAEAAADEDAEDAGGRKRGDEVGAGEKKRRLNLGSQELTRLWNLGGDSLEDLAKLDSQT